MLWRRGGWPESRLDTFERACSHIARERNEEHLIAASPPALSDLLDAAGCLCAVQLIAGIAGYTVGPGESDSAYPSPEAYGDGIERSVYKAALATKLFKAESDTCLVPVHRHIAEFLGARHLAQLIDGGFPAQRVLALITGPDGGVVTEMRGLSAWLAAQCPHARVALIECDPIGVGLYGDMGQFSLYEKRVLLNALKRARERLGSDLTSRHSLAAFGPLVTADMEPALREVLIDPARGEQHQMWTLFVLRILEEGSPLPELSMLLLDMARDNTRSPRVNALSLYTFLHTCPDGQDKTDRLKQLLVDIKAGRVDDPEDKLLGTLLSRLYPQDLPASKVWDYLSEFDGPNLMSSSFRFWSRCLLEQSSDEDVAELLDRLLCPPPGVHRALEAPRPYLGNLVFELLARGLRAHGDKIPPKRLYDWLGIGVFTIPHDDHEPSREVRAWLGQRPEIQKAIVVEGFQRAAQSPGNHLDVDVSRVERHLYGVNLPANFGPWCAEQAKKTTDLRVAEYFIRRAWWAGLSLETQRKQARDRPELRSLLSELIDRSKAEEQERRRQEQDYQREEQSYREERKRQEDEWLTHVCSNEIALRENRAAPILLYKLAEAYFGNLLSEAHDGPEAVAEELLGDPGLTRAALQGLRGTPARPDVPEPEEILDLRGKGRMHYLEWPFLAGLEEIERTTPEDAAQWDNSRIRKALTFYYCAPHGDYRPEWYRHLLEARPKAVADEQVRFAVSEFRSGSEIIYKLWELAHDPEHAQVARYATLPLLRAFPTRCKLKQLGELDNLLWAAIQHADRESFEELIEKKLSRTSMNHAQHAHWLTAGLVVSPTIYREQLNNFVRERERQIQQVATFFCDHHWEARYELGIPVSLEIPTVELFIRLIGSYVGPDLRWKQGFVSPAMEASRQVDTYIRHLAASPAKEASTALADLLADPALERWRAELSWARDSQRIIRRDAEYRHPTLEQVRETLSGGAPANSGDLTALLVDRLHEIAMRIRTGNTDDWRQYWNEPFGQEPTPKHEDHCRDALLSDLRQCLPPGIDAQPEGQYASDKRADIRVAYRDFQVPIEIKKNSHRELWRAIRNQLIAQYTIDPATGGHGIYLVFWFGRNYTQRSPNGDRPGSPAELKQQLERSLSEDETRKISVCVIDVSRPQQ